MATIKAFRPIKCGFNDNLKSHVQPEATEAKPKSIIAKIKEKLEQAPILSIQEHPALAAYQHIPMNINTLLKDGELEMVQKDGLYVCQITVDECCYTGLWALTSFNDFRTGRIKRHEFTGSTAIKELKRNREYTQIDGSPVLISYQPDQMIDELNAQVILTKSAIDSWDGDIRYRLWLVEDVQTIERYRSAFAEIGTNFLADGHARCCAIEEILNDKYGKRPLPETDPAVYFSSLYLSTDQIRVKAYHKLVKPLTYLSEYDLIQKLSGKFEIIRSGSNVPVKPAQPHHFGMLVNNNWYVLKAKDIVLKGASFDEQLDGHIFQNHILLPIFGGLLAEGQVINIGGNGAMEEMLEQARSCPLSFGFTFAPASVNQVTSAAYTDSMLPYKTTFIEPKIPFGLLIYHLNTAAL